MRQLVAKEHNLQKTIVRILNLSGVFFFETDVMDGLKFCSSQNTRISFINHHISMGYKKGQSDLILVLPKRIVFVELKNGKKGVQSDSQKEFQRKVEELGFEYIVWRSVDDCTEFLRELVNKK